MDIPVGAGFKDIFEFSPRNLGKQSSLMSIFSDGLKLPNSKSIDLDLFKVMCFSLYHMHHGGKSRENMF